MRAEAEERGQGRRAELLSVAGTPVALVSRLSAAAASPLLRPHFAGTERLPLLLSAASSVAASVSGKNKGSCSLH